MIFIDISNFSPPLDWLAKAQNLTNQLLDCTDASQRNKLIDENKSLWSELKPHFPHSNKCWISEATDCVGAFTIEHFRPKGAVTQLVISRLLAQKEFATEKEKKEFKANIEGLIEPRVDWTKENKNRAEGYWWLSFEYTNYLVCGSTLNSTKSNRFPIRKGSIIAYTPKDDSSKEKCLLLNPTQKGDTELLDFDLDGKVKPSEIDETKIEYIRAFISIFVYGLNAVPPLVNKRIGKWKECKKAIDRANKKYESYNSGEETAFEDFLDFVDKDIKPSIEPTSEFSAVAKACVLSYKDKYEWITKFILED